MNPDGQVYFDLAEEVPAEDVKRLADADAARLSAELQAYRERIGMILNEDAVKQIEKAEDDLFLRGERG